MAGKAKAKGASRAPLNKEAVLRAAIALADEAGIEALSMRRLGQELGVEAMSLYSHVANKDEILDGIVDLVVGQIEVPARGDDWRSALRRRANSAREVLLRHPWAPALIESRVNLSPARLRYCDAVIGALRDAGFTIGMAYNAFLLLDSYIYGFILQEASWQFDREELPEVVAGLRPQLPADEFPHVAEMMAYVAAGLEPGRKRGAGYSPEFETGLELILDSLERMRELGGPPGSEGTGKQS